jgi:acyl carrier protein phosphodiesterase
MNYLAHIYLSGDEEQLKIGNFIADSVKGKKYFSYPEPIQKGIILHRAIDSFTDSHPTVTESVTRLFPRYSHYSRVIVDILYDHFLAANWSDYSDVPLDKYVAGFYELLHKNYDVLPKQVKTFLPYMVQDNWLLNYATVEGIGRILSQMNRRTGNKSKMNLATEELKLYYSDFEKEFRSFFEDLQEFTAEKKHEL